MREFKTVTVLLVLAGCVVRASASEPNDEGLHASLIRTYDSLDVVSPSDIGARLGATIGVLSVLVDWQPGRVFRNSMTGVLHLSPDGWLEMTDKALTYTADSLIDNAIPLRIGDQGYLLRMERKGDRIALDDATQTPVLGLGSQIRFGESDWVPFLGSRYCSGGLSVTSEGLAYLQHTERLNNQGRAIYTGEDWFPVRE